MGTDRLSSISYKYPRYSLNQSKINGSDDNALLSFNSNNNYINPLEADAVLFSSNSTTNASVATQLKTELNKTKGEQGLIGKAWDGIKNLFGMKAGSNNVEKTIEKLEKGEITQEEAQEVLTKYQDGQKMCVDVVGDMISGIFAVGCAAAAPFTGGVSLLVAAGAGAAVKVAIKGADCILGGRKYAIKDFGYDLITGSINGAMAPLTNALGGVVGTGVAKVCGLNAGKVIVKETGEKVVEESFKQAGKSFLSNLLAKQGTEYVAKVGAKTGIKTTLATLAAYGADMAVDGALGGATDGFARSLAEGDFENMGENVTQSFVGGLITAPIIGGGFRLAGKLGSEIGNKLFGKTTASAVADNADSIPSRITELNATSSVTAIQKENGKTVVESLSDKTTSKISNGVVDTIADSTSDNIVKETSENIGDGITAAGVKETSKNAADGLPTTVLPKQNSNFQVENNGTYITKIEYVSKNGERKVIDGVKISNTYKFGDAELEIFTDLVEDGVDSKSAMYATRLLSRNSFETQQEREIFIKCIRSNIDFNGARHISGLFVDCYTPEQDELLNACLGIGLRSDDIAYAVGNNLDIEKCKHLAKIRSAVGGGDYPLHVITNFDASQCDSYYSLVRNGINPRLSYDKIASGEFTIKQAEIFEKLIGANVNNQLAFKISTQDFSPKQFDLFISICKRGVQPDIACIAAKNNFSEDVLNILTGSDGFEFQLNELQNDGGYKIVAQKTNGFIAENIEILENGRVRKFASEKLADDIYKESVSGSDRSIIIKQDWLGKIGYQIEIVNDDFGNPSYILHSVPSKDLAGAFDIVRYDYSDYPKGFDLETAVRNGEITGGQILAGTKRLKDGSVEYFENLEYQGNKTTRRYTQSLDGNSMTSTKYSYNIVDKNGETILNIDRSWSKNSDGSTTTVINGRTYTAKFDDSSKVITVVDDKGNTETIIIPEKFYAITTWLLGQYGSKEAVYEEFYGLCKNMPADMLLELDKIEKISFITGSFSSNNSARGLIEISPSNTHENLGVVAHELGHSFDGVLKVISNDKDLIEIYSKEMSNFESIYPKHVQNTISYFNQEGGSGYTGLSEVVAEANTLFKTYNHGDEYLTDRAQYLVRYFPRTLAYILNVFNK